jgi:hypothetical protein
MNQAIKEAAAAKPPPAICPHCKQAIEAASLALRQWVETGGCAACRVKPEIDLHLLMPN